MGEKKYGMAKEYSQQDIISALNLLKDVCMASDCKHCPFASSGKENFCKINFGAPGDWQIKAEKDWRAFREDEYK